jgi:L,D-peptidoglycan transpeptidase YkuD (ErfK/YbiS/YcfS/YnhG family)
LRSIVAGASAAMVLCTAVTVAGAAPAVHPSSRPPLGLRRIDGARQLVVVRSTSSSSSYARLTTYEDTGHGWRPVFGAMAARVGADGWLPGRQRREGDGTTPEGVYAFGTTVYGNAPDPGVALRYHRLVPGDYWDENPATGRRYNTFEHSSDTDCADNPYGGATECLWLERAPYPYFAVIDFNTPARGPYGSGIFLHVTIGATEGCVSLSRADLVRVLRWLRPEDRPRIVLAGALPLHDL